jgi:hypothetical protein
VSEPFLLDGEPAATQPTPEASIAVADVPLVDDNEAIFANPPDDAAIYTDYVVENRYAYDQGKRMMGVTSPQPYRGASAAFVTLRKPTLVWTADWTAARFHVQPDVPDPASVSGDWVLLHARPVSRNVTVGSDGKTKLFRISGTYVYGHKNPGDDVFASVQFGLPPYLADGAPPLFQQSAKKGGIMEGTGAGPGGGGGGQPSPGDPGIPPGGPTPA